jgi:ATP-binding cassette subfamily B multidrug efflux pump
MIRGIAGLVEGSEERATQPAAISLRLGRELAPFTGGLGLAVGLVIVAAVTQAVGPWLVAHAIDVDISHRDGTGLLHTMGWLLMAYCVGVVAQRAQVYQIGSIGQKVLAQLRLRLFAKFQTLPVGFFDSQPIGDLMSRVTNDVDTLNQLISQGLSQLLGALFGLAGILVAMLLLSVPLALASFMVIPIMLCVIAYLARQARQAYRTTRETTGAVMAGLQEEIGGVREAQAFNRTAENLTRFRARNASNRDANISATAISSAFTPAIEVLGTLSTALVIGYGAYLVQHGSLSLGLLAAFLIYVQQFFRPIQLATQVAAQFQSALAGAERIFSILDEPSEVEQAVAGATPLAGLGRVEFRAVTFGYKVNRPVLAEITFVAEPGQTIALVGPTGAGKTSIVNLIPRFYDADLGTVLVDGQDVRGVSREALRAQIALVTQEPFLFGGTVAENLAYGRPGAPLGQIEAIAKAVGAHDFITALPLGYQTPLGEGAGLLSNGQRQLLSIARALLADRPILLLDEATSHIDSRTEAALQQALKTVMKGRTSIVIAHRLSTIRHADRILVIDAGRIVEAGTHEELVALEGLYAQLARHNDLDRTPIGARTSGA